MPNPSLGASTFEQMGNVEEAIKEATVAARLNQGAEGYFVHLAELYVRAKKYEQAESVFEQLAASNNPTISSLAKKRLEELKAADGQQKAQTPKE
jgi:thioredoxin-like negative regulator of GroEL